MKEEQLTSQRFSELLFSEDMLRFYSHSSTIKMDGNDTCLELMNTIYDNGIMKNAHVTGYSISESTKNWDLASEDNFQTLNLGFDIGDKSYNVNWDSSQTRKGLTVTELMFNYEHVLDKVRVKSDEWEEEFVYTIFGNPDESFTVLYELMKELIRTNLDSFIEQAKKCYPESHIEKWGRTVYLCVKPGYYIKCSRNDLPSVQGMKNHYFTYSKWTSYQYDTYRMSEQQLQAPIVIEKSG